MAVKVHLVDPECLFPKHPPYQPLFKKGEQNDLTEVDMQSYLQILSSIGLYGFKYAVEINQSHGILNGDFRTFAARELGLKLPVVHVRLAEGRTLLIVILLRKLRKLCKNQSLFFRKFDNPEFKHVKYDRVLLLSTFQLPLFDSIYPKRTDLIVRDPDKPSIVRKIATVIGYYLKKERYCTYCGEEKER